MKRNLPQCGGFLLLLLILAACSEAPQETPTPTVNLPTIRVDITPAAQPAAAALNACAEVMSTFDLEVRERFASVSDGDLLIRLGAPEDSPQPEAGFLAQIATEDIRVVLNPNNPISSLTRPELLDLFSGKTTDWRQLDGKAAPVYVWVPLAAEETRKAFESEVMESLPVVPDARLAPDPAAMLEAISADPNTIGYLPAAWETGDLQTTLLGIHMPVLVQADATPTGPAADLVACMQGAIGQLALLDLYP
jgi:hypothetical protein